MKLVHLTIVLAVCIACPIAAAHAQSDRWEKDIAKFEAQDAKNPPAEGGIVFVGSSSIRMWDLGKSFPDLKPVNRGFGGSVIADATQYIDRIIVPHKPRQIVMYSGDNDMGRGNSKEQVLADFKQFVHKVMHKLPETKIAFVAIKPSIKRWDKWPAMKEANDLVRKYCETSEKLQFIDIAPVTLGADGKPDPSLFKNDGLHLSDKGYDAWNARVRETLGW